MVLKRLGVTVSDLYENHNCNCTRIDVLKLGIQLVKSIRQLHSLGYVHLDLKPDNMMFDASSIPVQNFHAENNSPLE